MPVYKINYFKYFCSFEKLLHCTKSFNCSNYNVFVNSLRGIANKYYYNFKPHKVFSSVFSKADISLIRKFASDKTVIVTKPDKGRGVVATLLVVKGTLNPGDIVVAGSTYGKIRTMLNDKSNKVKKLV